jgi:hypothetical protein
MLADGAPDGIDHFHRRESTFALRATVDNLRLVCQPKLTRVIQA